jgi:hypothetical protein
MSKHKSGKLSAKFTTTTAGKLQVFIRKPAIAL